MISKTTLLTAAVLISSMTANSSFADINPICNPSPEPIKQKYNNVAKATNEKSGLQTKDIEVLDSVFNHGKILFFKGDGPFATYVTLDTDFRAAQHVFNQIQQTNYPELQNRGEAHITILTPVEYFCIFGSQNIYGTPAISMDQIQKIIEKVFKKKLSNNVAYDVAGIGNGQKTIFDTKTNKFKVAETFFLITPSDDLLLIRKEIRALLKGAAYEAFVPEKFYPHITLGYTDMDLHDSDGVRKNAEYSLDPRFKIIGKEN